MFPPTQPPVALSWPDKRTRNQPVSYYIYLYDTCSQSQYTLYMISNDSHTKICVFVRICGKTMSSLKQEKTLLFSWAVFTCALFADSAWQAWVQKLGWDGLEVKGFNLLLVHGKNVEFANLFPGKFCFWGEIFANLRVNSSFRWILWSFSYKKNAENL